VTLTDGVRVRLSEVQRAPRSLSRNETHHRRRLELATAVSDLDRPSVIEMLDASGGRVIERWLRSLPVDMPGRESRLSIDPSKAGRRDTPES